MNYISFPKPTGYEVIKLNGNELFTLSQVLNLKNKVGSIVQRAQDVVDSDNINNNNLLNFVILYEYQRYSDIIQPINILDFFLHLVTLYNSIQKNSKTLTKHQFDKLDSCCYKNISKFFTQTKLEALTTCLICTDKYISNDDIVVLPCKHNFHKKCIKRWLTQESNECPLCKVGIT